jgi:oligopeptide transport system substrate-binding protein
MPGMIIKGAADFTAGLTGAEGVAIRATDDRHFEVTLMGPIAFAIDSMAHYAFGILPMHVIRAHGDAWTRPGNFVGNGPFVLSEWIPNDRLVVIPNERYWNKDNVHLSRIIFLPIEDTNTAFQGFRNGEIDWSTNPPMALIDELSLRPDFHTYVQIGTYYLHTNNSHPVLADPRIRQALSIVIDRNELTQRISRGGEVPAYGLVPPIGDYKIISGEDYLNVERARELLASAGFPNGQGLPTFTFLYNTLDLHRLIAEYLQQVWLTTLGVNISLQNMEWATFLEARRQPSMELARSGWIADYADPQNFLELLLSNGGNNDSRYNNPEYDRLVLQAASMPPGPQRYEIMRQAEELAMIKEQAMIPIYYYVSQHLIDLNVWAGWYTNAKDIHPWVGIRRR